MIIGIVGSRNFKSKKLVQEIVKTIHPTNTIVSGGARGVDSWAVEQASKQGIVTEEIIPDWDRLGKMAGPQRNSAIVERSDAVIAFWDGSSRGTRDSITKARDCGKLLMLIIR